MGYNTATAQDRLQAVIDNIDGGSGPGVLALFTAGYAVRVAEFELARPCGTIAGRVLTFSGMPRVDVSAANAGTPVLARFEDAGGNVIRNGLTVGTTGTDVIISTATVAQGDQVSLISATITHPTGPA